MIKVSEPPRKLCSWCKKNMTFWKVGKIRKPICGPCLEKNK